jgi:TetR/AcrR family transcriptional repressor of nem operon
MAALAQEVARSTPELKAAFERGEAIFQSAALIGGVVLACAVQNEQLSEEILKRVRQKVS